MSVSRCSGSNAFRLECEHCYIFWAKWQRQHIHFNRIQHTRDCSKIATNFHFMSPSWCPYHFLCNVQIETQCQTGTYESVKGFARWRWQWRFYFIWSVLLFNSARFCLFFFSGDRFPFFVCPFSGVKSLFHVNQAKSSHKKEIVSRCIVNRGKSNDKNMLTSRWFEADKKKKKKRRIRNFPSVHDLNSSHYRTGSSFKHIMTMSIWNVINALSLILLPMCEKKPDSPANSQRIKWAKQKKQRTHDHNKWS